MITNIIFTLYEFNSKVESNLYDLQIVLGANMNKLPKGNRKDSENQKYVSERTLAWAAPRKSSEREMVEPVDDCKCHG